MTPFKFDLNQRVKMVESDEQGQIIGRAEYTNACPSYLVRLKNANGAQVERWWCETAIVPANPGT